MRVKETLIQSPFSPCLPHFYSRRHQSHLLLLLSAVTPPFTALTPHIVRDRRGFTSFKHKNHRRHLCLNGCALLCRPVQILTPKVLPPQRRIPPLSPHRDTIKPASSSSSHDLGRRRFVDFVFFIFLLPLTLLLFLRASLFSGGGGCD
ncbi:hypothetical protein PIB30_042338 [Stylosanthes scabra]|uniref:Transmembrane protein n=1 Tax=Stylosanthes scabra TaxID=79078 RepID=A0ABU6SFG4_9FABA|nr:hypothetical protein [Stylosanthes scabra]